MRLMFVYWRTSNAGSAQTIRHYAEAARELGHEVVIYARRTRRDVSRARSTSAPPTL